MTLPHMSLACASHHYNVPGAAQVAIRRSKKKLSNTRVTVSAIRLFPQITKDETPVQHNYNYNYKKRKAEVKWQMITPMPLKHLSQVVNKIHSLFPIDWFAVGDSSLSSSPSSAPRSLFEGIECTESGTVGCPFTLPPSYLLVLPTGVLTSLASA
jgi:hypothetical protein